MWMCTWPLSSAVPRPNRLPSRTVGLKSGRSPEVERFRRLHVVVAVKKDGGLAGSLEGFRIDQRVKIRGNDLNRFKSGGREFVGDPAGGALDIGLVLAFGADAGDAQEFAQLRQMPVAATFDKFCKVHVRSQECESLPVRIRLKIFRIFAAVVRAHRNTSKDSEAAYKYFRAAGGFWHKQTGAFCKDILHAVFGVRWRTFGAHKPAGLCEAPPSEGKLGAS